MRQTSLIFQWDTLNVLRPHDLQYQTRIVAGSMGEIQLISGNTIRVWQAVDRREFFCHGLTFGGKDGPTGTISPYTGKPVETILADLYELVPEVQAGPGDILVWQGLAPETTPHSAVLTDTIVLPGEHLLAVTTQLRTKNGLAPEGTMTLGQLIAIYGESYRISPTIATKEPTMADSPPLTASPSTTVLACRLRPKRSSRMTDVTAGEVELENVSGETMEIEVTISLWQYLNLVVTDGQGNTVSAEHYGEFFSPLAEPYTFRLQPGEKLTSPVSLLATVPSEKRLPGRYAIHAVFEYRTFRVVSEQIMVEFSFTEPVLQASSSVNGLVAPLGTESQVNPK